MNAAARVTRDGCQRVKVIDVHWLGTCWGIFIDDGHALSILAAVHLDEDIGTYYLRSCYFG